MYQVYDLLTVSASDSALLIVLLYLVLPACVDACVETEVYV